MTARPARLRTRVPVSARAVRRFTRAPCIRAARALVSRSVFAQSGVVMKPDIHPQYKQITVTCSCGKRLRDGLDRRARPQHRGLLRLPPVLHRQAEGHGHGRPGRQVPSPLRLEVGSVTSRVRSDPPDRKMRGVIRAARERAARYRPVGLACARSACERRAPARHASGPADRREHLHLPRLAVLARHAARFAGATGQRRRRVRRHAGRPARPRTPRARALRLRHLRAARPPERDPSRLQGLAPSALPRARRADAALHGARPRARRGGHRQRAGRGRRRHRPLRPPRPAGGGGPSPSSAATRISPSTSSAAGTPTGTSAATRATTRRRSNGDSASARRRSPTGSRCRGTPRTTSPAYRAWARRPPRA